MRRLPVIALLALAFAACKKGQDSAATSGPAAVDKATPQARAPGSSIAGNGVAQPDNRKIVRTGALRISVGTYDEARAKLDALLQEVGGYVDSTQVSRGRNAITDATIVVRLPSDKFGAIVPRLRELGEIASESTNAADITDQYVDISARLASAQALEKRLIELATERNGTIDSVLAVEKELARVRGEIEGYEGRLRMWNDQIAMSTLTLTLSTRTPEIVASTSFSGRVSSAFHDSVHALREVAGWFVVLFVALLPWCLILALIALVGRKAIAKLRG
ncbi:MAG TPA: DUF4349 domain-containing protein [Kofleriaceae bacterium]|nr:DUF4349 domain-containing protein [Kofleriaceae bacterium]